jgi:hypothetical protein
MFKRSFTEILPFTLRSMRWFNLKNLRAPEAIAGSYFAIGFRVIEQFQQFHEVNKEHFLCIPYIILNSCEKTIDSSSIFLEILLLINSFFFQQSSQLLQTLRWEYLRSDVERSRRIPRQFKSSHVTNQPLCVLQCAKSNSTVKKSIKKIVILV